VARLKLRRFTADLPKYWVGPLGVLMLAIVGFLDYLAGYNMNLSLFYLVPICFVAAKAGRGAGIIMSLAGALALCLVQALNRPPEMAILLLAWNVVLRGGLFLLVVIGLTALQEETRRQRAQIEVERLRSSILSSVSHDLRTPLAAITGAASTLLEPNDKLSPASRQELMETIYEEAGRLSIQVSNLLEMTRLESGTLRIRRELQPLEETVGAACRRLERQLAGRPLTIFIPPELPMIPADGVLLEQVFFNLLENATKYTPPGSALEILARRMEDSVQVEVADRGPGLTEEEKERVFEKFYRGQRHGSKGGAGLGLAICKGVVLAHGGRIWAANRPGGGAVFSFTLPLGGHSARFDHPAEPG
jgi:two-component system sensor histidine kinase KdpD